MPRIKLLIAWLALQITNRWVLLIRRAGAVKIIQGLDARKSLSQSAFFYFFHPRTRGTRALASTYTYPSSIEKFPRNGETLAD